MNIDTELSNLEVFYTDIENNFKNSININSHLKNEINKVKLGKKNYMFNR